MAIATTILAKGPTGRGTVGITGKYVISGGSTGGDIQTGLKNVYACLLNPFGAAVLANQSVVNETFPLAGGDVTIVTSANESGSFYAEGVGL